MGPGLREVRGKGNGSAWAVRVSACGFVKKGLQGGLSMCGGHNREPMLGAPRTLSLCTVCGEYTPHEWVEGDGVVAKICINPTPKALNSLSRDSRNGRAGCLRKVSRRSSRAAPASRFGGFRARAGWREASETRPRRRHGGGTGPHDRPRAAWREALRGGERSGCHRRSALSACMRGVGDRTPGEGLFIRRSRPARAASRSSTSR